MRGQKSETLHLNVKTCDMDSWISYHEKEYNPKGRMIIQHLLVFVTAIIISCKWIPAAGLIYWIIAGVWWCAASIISTVKTHKLVRYAKPLTDLWHLGILIFAHTPLMCIGRAYIVHSQVSIFSVIVAHTGGLVYLMAYYRYRSLAAYSVVTRYLATGVKIERSNRT